MTVNCHKPDQMMTQNEAAVIDVISLVVQINIVPDTWYAAINLSRLFSQYLL